MIVGNDARELVKQIEDHVRAPLVDRLAQLGEVIADADDANLRSKAAQRMQNVVLGAEFVDLQFAHAGDVLRRHERLVHHQQDPAFPHKIRRRTRAAARSVGNQRLYPMQHGQ